MKATATSAAAVSTVWKDRFAGVDRLYGSGAVERLSHSAVAVVGMGGVGSWVVEALASELDGASREDRARLADRLISKAGTYELADEGGLAAAHNARLQLAYLVAARLTAEPR